MWQILIVFGLLSFKLFRWFQSNLQSSFFNNLFIRPNIQSWIYEYWLFSSEICFCFAQNGFLFENQNRQKNDNIIVCSIKKAKTHFVVTSMTICQAELLESHKTVNFVIHCADYIRDHPFKTSAIFHNFLTPPPFMGLKDISVLFLDFLKINLIFYGS